MSGRRFLFWLIIALIIAALAKPRATWTQLNRIWGRRHYTLRVLVAVIIVYLAYGFYQYYITYWAE